MILFLDFDGVLHPLFTRPELPPEESRPFCYLPRFATVLRDYPSVEVVISSTWRITRDLEQLREPFPHVLRPRVIGTTPHLFDDERFGARQREAVVAELGEVFGDQRDELGIRQHPLLYQVPTAGCGDDGHVLGAEQLQRSAAAGATRPERGTGCSSHGLSIGMVTIGGRRRSSRRATVCARGPR